MRKIKFIAALIFIAGLQSCTKDLDVVSENPRVLSPDDLFSTPEGYKQGLAGVYGNLSLTGTGDAGSSFLQGIDAGTSQFGSERSGSPPPHYNRGAMTTSGTKDMTLVSYG